MKSKKTIIVISFGVFIFLLGDSVRVEVTVLKYFWPLTVGKIFVYGGDKGKVIRLMRIKEVLKEDSCIKVRIENNIKGYDFPVSFEEEYQIDLDRNLIFRDENTNRMDKKIYLKGPIKIGLEWDTKVKEFKAVITGKKEEIERKIKKGRCRIDNIYDEVVLGKRRSCLEINCFDVENKNALIKSFFCEDLGYVGMKSVTSGEWIERLKKIE